MTIQYMTTAGVFACSCQSEADKPDPALIEAPPGGFEGMRWDGQAWVEVQTDEARKLHGIEFEGVMCSATAADQAGLIAVLMAIQLQGASFQPTRFEFDNGNALAIHLGNFQAFTAVWLPFRQSFFTVA